MVFVLYLKFNICFLLLYPRERSIAWTNSTMIKSITCIILRLRSAIIKLQIWSCKRGHYTLIFSATSITKQLAGTNWIHSSFARVNLSHGQTHIFSSTVCLSVTKSPLQIKDIFVPYCLSFYQCFTKRIVKVSDWTLRTVRYGRMIPQCLWTLWCIFCMNTPLSSLTSGESVGRW